MSNSNDYFDGQNRSTKDYYYRLASDDPNRSGREVFQDEVPESVQDCPHETDAYLKGDASVGTEPHESSHIVSEANGGDHSETNKISERRSDNRERGDRNMTAEEQESAISNSEADAQAIDAHYTCDEQPEGCTGEPSTTGSDLSLSEVELPDLSLPAVELPSANHALASIALPASDLVVTSSETGTVLAEAAAEAALETIGTAITGIAAAEIALVVRRHLIPESMDPTKRNILTAATAVTAYVAYDMNPILMFGRFAWKMGSIAWRKRSRVYRI